MTRLFTLLALLLPGALRAQAALTGVVKADSANRGVAGVEVVVQALDLKATTDSAGRFTLGGLAHGAHIVIVRAIGYQPLTLRAYLVTNDTLEVELRIHRAAVQLAPIEVTATAVPPGLDAFEERRLDGFGKFIDWTVLRKSEHRQLVDVFRDVQGVRIRYDRNGQPYLSSSRDSCPMQVYLNGVVIFKPSFGPGGSGSPPIINHWNVSDLDAIEIYRGASETPAMYGGAGSTCGTVLMWTRRR